VLGIAGPYEFRIGLARRGAGERLDVDQRPAETAEFRPGVTKCDEGADVVLARERLGHAVGPFAGDDDHAGIRLRDEVAQKIAPRRGVQRHGYSAELAKSPDSPDELRTIRHHQRHMIALADTETGEAIGVAVGDVVRLGVAEFLIAMDQPGAVADALRLVGQQASYRALLERIIIHHQTPR